MTDKYTTPSSWPWGFHRVRPIHLSSTVRKHLRPQAGMRRQPDGLSKKRRHTDWPWQCRKPRRLRRPDVPHRYHRLNIQLKATKAAAARCMRLPLIRKRALSELPADSLIFMFKYRLSADLYIRLS